MLFTYYIIVFVHSYISESVNFLFSSLLICFCSFCIFSFLQFSHISFASSSVSAKSIHLLNFEYPHQSNLFAMSPSTSAIVFSTFQDVRMYIGVFIIEYLLNRVFPYFFPMSRTIHKPFSFLFLPDSEFCTTS